MNRGRRKLLLASAVAAAASRAPSWAASGGRPSSRVTWLLTRDEISEKRIRAAFASRGWIDGGNLALAFEPWTRDGSRLERIVAGHPDVIVNLGGGEELKILQRLTREIPVVFYNWAGDPVRSGVARTIARPGGNFTGAVVQWREIITKHWQLLKDFHPSMRRGACLLAEVKTTPHEDEEFGDALRAAEKGLGIEIAEITLPPTATASDIEGRVRAARVEALQVDFPITPELVAFVSRTRVPTAGYSFRRARLGGAIVGISFEWDEGESHAVDAVVRIIRGERPASMPVYMTSRYAIALNARLAREAGLAIPPSVLLQAQEVFR